MTRELRLVRPLGTFCDPGDLPGLRGKCHDVAKSLDAADLPGK
jgi:hypothetical protein